MDDVQLTDVTDGDLPTILRQMLTDIEDHQCCYWLYTNYFDALPPTEREDTRWHMCPLYIDFDSLWNPEFVADGMQFDVILRNKLPAEKERIKVEYAQVHKIKRVHFDEEPKSEPEYMVYKNSAKWQMPPTHT